MKEQETAEPSIRLSSVAPLRRTPSPPTSESTRPPAQLSTPRPIFASQWPKRILGIDIENGPDWYGGGDFVYDRIFCLSFKWVNHPEIHTVWVDWAKKDATIRRQLEPLIKAIERSDRLLGHNFRHDWKGLTGLFRELNMTEPKKPPIVDTMRCIPAGIPRSLKDLCKRFDLGEKPELATWDWTRAIRRQEPEAIAKVIDRNRTDVILTERLYHKEREIGWLTNRTRTR
jgi:hypothetical protein